MFTAWKFTDFCLFQQHVNIKLTKSFDFKSAPWPEMLGVVNIPGDANPSQYSEDSDIFFPERSANPLFRFIYRRRDCDS
jgi:hypothetical protein